MNTPPVGVDSEPDTLRHIRRVNELMGNVASEMIRRGIVHDASKLIEPEKSGFDRIGGLKLSGMAYGSEEYRACLRAEKPTIDHHYKVNSHHPEFYGNGVEGMSLFDLTEMLMDWKAASERMANGGDIRKSIEINTGRFKLSPQVVAILLNTVERMGW